MGKGIGLGNEIATKMRETTGVLSQILIWVRLHQLLRKPPAVSFIFTADEFLVMERDEIVGEIERAVTDICSEYDNVVAAYLYGSFARADEDAESDVDIGLLFEEYDIHTLLEIGRRIEDKVNLSRELDVRALNTSDPEFPFRVLKEAEVLYEKDKARRADLEQRIERKYFDMKPYIEEYRRERKKRMA